MPTGGFAQSKRGPWEFVGNLDDLTDYVEAQQEIVIEGILIKMMNLIL